MKRFLSTKAGQYLAIALVMVISGMGGSLAYALAGLTATSGNNTVMAASGDGNFRLWDGTAEQTAINDLLDTTGLGGSPKLGGTITIKNSGNWANVNYAASTADTGTYTTNPNLSMRDQLRVAVSTRASGACDASNPIATGQTAIAIGPSPTADFVAWKTTTDGDGLAWLAGATGTSSLATDTTAVLCVYFKLNTTPATAALGVVGPFTLTLTGS